LLRGDETLGVLPSASQELKSLQEQLTRAGYELTDELEGEAISLIHVSAHGQSYGSRGETGPLLRLDQEGIDGAQLALLCERAASGSAHPVLYLSACELGRPQQDSPAAWDLTARALHSGARCVIASMWALPDPVATFISERFYERYLNGEPPSQALALAQAEASARWLDPVFWGALALWGGLEVS